jgi:transposase
MGDAVESLRSDLAAAHATILSEYAARPEAEAVAARAQAVNSHSEALIAHLKLKIEKLRRELYDSSSEQARLLAQMESQI